MNVILKVKNEEIKQQGKDFRREETEIYGYWMKAIQLLYYF